MGVEVPRSDADLLRASREGDAAAFGQLYERHVAAARALARQLVRGTEAEDVVAEAFTKILDLVGRGGGPESGFRTYLLTVVRRTVYDRSRVEGRQLTTGEIEEYDPGVPFVDPALVGLERSLIARAYLSLPERWRAVLWHTEVERSRPAEVAPLLGLSANGVAALAYRAREGLRQAYLQMHLGTQPRRECRPVLGKMGAYVRGGLARRESRFVDEHVSGCEECHGVLLELTDVNRGLRVMVGPLFAGPLFGGYAAALAKGGAGGAAGLLRALAALRRAPRHQQAVLAGGLAVAAAVTLAFLLVSGDGPAREPATAAPGLLGCRCRRRSPPSRRHRRPASGPRGAAAPAGTPSATPRGQARLRAAIDPLGSLVRAQAGIVGIRLRNDGDAPSEALAALVELPRGVTLVPTARDHQAAALSGPAGTVDGWACRPTAAAPGARGPRCGPGRARRCSCGCWSRRRRPRARGRPCASRPGRCGCGRGPRTACARAARPPGSPPTAG
ncbi:sigma-70 family RNA polymerase sigma factor [Actinomadura sp. ATCC 31491]|uniref:Sigma-70 family RNA polymerase sigma factor n=1 Tax=Actinomadura luzonensis TaxID=2805427 RepID=A0ABT0FQC1_9ACTN|nr:sigma-70 family RNA polymerase sigma factor [Actinomadura luzonensis]MCK2214505.1 sigma-70 family RNA polymerase sigma factor [Actinomadura luzonensis]